MDTTAGRKSWRLGRQLELAFAIFGIIFYQGAFVSTIRYARGDEHLLAGETEIGSTIAQFVIMFGLVFAVWTRRRPMWGTIRDMIPYLLVIGLCGVSALWSAFPFPTVRRTVTLAICVIFGHWCYLVFGMNRLLSLLERITLFLGVCSIVVLVAMPRVGLESALGYESAMRGVFAQKNTLGAAMLLAISCSMYSVVVTPAMRWRAMLSTMFLLGCQVLAKSATSLLISLVVIGIGSCMAFRRDWRALAIIVYLFVSAGVLLLAVLIIDPVVLFGLVGRDASFTGRLPLWQISWEAARARLWLGYGYSGFWTGDSRLVQYIWAMLNWQAPSAHNGYLDILLQIGVVGLAIYLWMWIRIAIVSYAAPKDPLAKEAMWILMFMVVNVVLNLDEGPLPYPDQFTLLFPGVLLFLNGWLRTRRAARERQRRASVPLPIRDRLRARLAPPGVMAPP